MKIKRRITHPLTAVLLAWSVSIFAIGFPKTAPASYLDSFNVPHSTDKHLIHRFLPSDGEPEADAVTRSPDKYIDAVRLFAETALIHARDSYGEKKTDLFADGLSRDKLTPAKWKLDGKTIILSDFASRQNFLRTLTGLSALTGDPKYVTAAKKDVAYAFEHLRAPNGLLHWGGQNCYDLQEDRVVGGEDGECHTLKSHYPYYPLLWEVDPKATETLLKAFWEAHVLNWSNLDMNRLGGYKTEPVDLSGLWNRSYDGGKVFFQGEGRSFANTGSDLIYAGMMLHGLSGDNGACLWAERLAERYEETRNPQTGLVGYQYSYKPPDRAQKQFGTEYGSDVLEGTVIDRHVSRVRYARMGICELMLAEKLAGETEGKNLKTWASDALLSLAEKAYNPSDNTFCAMFTDGTPMWPETVDQPGYYPPYAFAPVWADGEFFRAYALAYTQTGDERHWKTARDIAGALDLGDLGSDESMNQNTGCSDPEVLIGLLELYRYKKDVAYINLACRIGDNILKDRFCNGLFLPSKNHRYAKLDALEPLALLALAGELKGEADLVPDAWPGKSYYINNYDEIGEMYDNDAIYAQRDDTLVFEAEFYSRQLKFGAHEWIKLPLEEQGASRDEVMVAMRSVNYEAFSAHKSETSPPRLDFNADFEQSGRYYVWIRGKSITEDLIGSDSVTVGIDGTSSQNAQNVGGFCDYICWASSRLSDGGRAFVDVPDAGSHTVNIWMGTERFALDKIVLTADPDYIPEDPGPADSTRVLLD